MTEGPVILAIETSCDETAVAVLSKDSILAQSLYSQQEHASYGGVVPEIAARDHQARLPAMVEDVMQKSGYSLKDLTEVAYTHGPGLAGCLLVGHYYALGLASGLQIPLRGIHHLEGHIMSVLSLGSGTWSERFDALLPCVVLIVSGGHSQFVEVTRQKYTVVGETQDDAVGEVFDKVARLLGIPYPGGAALSKLARGGQVVYTLPKPMIDRSDGTMSFSGLKTASRLLWERLLKEHNGASDEVWQQLRADFAASFEHAIIDTLMHKIRAVMRLTSIRHFAVVGGVSANTTLRNSLNAWSEAEGIQAYYPPLVYCTDNAVMIGIASQVRYALGAHRDEPNIRLRLQLQAPIV